MNSLGSKFLLKSLQSLALTPIPQTAHFRHIVGNREITRHLRFNMLLLLLLLPELQNVKYLIQSKYSNSPLPQSKNLNFLLLV